MQKIIPHLIKAEALPDYKSKVEFEDCAQGIIDLKKWKGKGVFQYWSDEKNFKNFKITVDKKVEWNHQIDMDPDAFYLELTGKTFDEYAYERSSFQNLITLKKSPFRG